MSYHNVVPQHSPGMTKGTMKYFRRGENNIKMYIREMWSGDVDWIHPVTDMDLQQILANILAIEPTDSIKRQEFLFSSQNGLCSMELVKIPHQRFGLSTSKIQIIHVTVKLMSYDASA